MRRQSRRRRPSRKELKAKKQQTRAKAKERRRGRAFSEEQAPLIARVMAMVQALSPDLRKWLTLNVPLVIVAILQLWKGGRSGNGWLTLCAIGRALPLDITEKAREHRLYRILACKTLDGTEMTPLLVRLALGDHPPRWVPIVLDQTSIRGTQVIMGGVRVAHRVLPVAFTTFEYDTIRKSQNIVESALLKLIAASLPAGCKPLFVMDRGYARAQLFKELDEVLHIPFLVRVKGSVIAQVGSKRMAINRLPRASHNRSIRHANVSFQSQKKKPVDIVVFHSPSFKEPWFLAVPPNSSSLLPTDEVVDLYRERMHIELTFRDWKTHLGVRGLRLEVDVAARLGRLLLAVTAAYIVTVILGACDAARQVRQDCEVLRPKPRHGTRRRLGALSIGILFLSLGRFAGPLARTLPALLAYLANGSGAPRLATSPP